MRNFLVWCRRILIILTIGLLCCSIGIAIYILSMKNKCCCINDIYYQVATIFATLCVGIIPLIVACDSEIKNENRRLEELQTRTHDELNVFIKLCDEKNFAFVNCVISCIDECYKFSDNYNNFFENHMDFDSLYALMDKSVNDSKYNEFDSMLKNVIDSSVFLLEENDKKEFEKAKDEEKTILFYRIFVSILNKFELLCYNHINARVSEDIFMDQIGKLIVKFYFRSYYIIHDIAADDGFPYIEATLLTLGGNNDGN
ncbi:MAG: hypothetical protein MJ245_07165 [Clostridia bacterium]|nr:hypothetical protein [Clostridia bacterium]